MIWENTTPLCCLSAYATTDRRQALTFAPDHDEMSSSTMCSSANESAQ